MKPESQIAILKTIVAFQADEIDALQEQVEALEKVRGGWPTGKVGKRIERPLLEFPPEYYESNVLTGSIQGDTETITVTVPPKWEDIDESTAIA